MKKLLLSLCMLAIVAITSNGFGQSTGTTPYPGATHTYSVSSTADSWTWTIYKGSVAGANEITSFPGSGVESFTATNGQVVIEWSTTATVDDEYLVVVTETVGTCENTKALPVIITASNFDLVVTAGADACYTDDVVVAWTGGQATTDVTYDHGEATVSYKVEATGVGASETWSFKPNMTYVAAGTYAESFTVTPTSGSVTESAGVYTVTGPQTVTVAVTIDNQNSYTNASADNAQNYEATMTLSDVACGTGSVEKDATNNDGAVDVSRPNTSQITTN